MSLDSASAVVATPGQRPVFNLVIGMALLGGGCIALTYLAPLVFDWDRFRALMLDTTLNPGMKVSGFILTTLAAVFAVVLGAVSIGRRRSRRLFDVNVMLCVTAALLLVCVEGMARFSINHGIAPLNAPALYANGFCDDDYWKLLARKLSVPKLPENVYDPVLGWTLARSKDNPHGLSLHAANPGHRDLPFYGDSFMQARTPPEDSVPAIVQRLLPDYQTLNFGVGGYGIDQIYLRYDLSADEFPARPIVFSIMTRDIDRSMLSIRDAIKPQFQLKNDAISLAGTPVPRDPEAWLSAHPVSIRSYSLSVLSHLAVLIKTGFDSSQSECNVKEKVELNRRILDRVLARAAGLDQRIVGLIFVEPRDLVVEQPGWRYLFLKDYFEKHDVPYVDTLAVIRADMQRSMRKTGDYFIQGDGHPNAVANTLIADKVAEVLTRVAQNK
jgi:hypothetical protein